MTACICALTLASPDATALARWQDDTGLRDAFGGPDWSNKRACLRWIEDRQAQPAVDDRLLRDADGKALGLVSLRDLRPPGMAMVSYGLAAPFRGQGLGRAVLRAALGLAGDRALTVLRAVTASDNAASSRVLVANGFAAIREASVDMPGIERVTVFERTLR